jgi:hypothetical protein
MQTGFPAKDILFRNLQIRILDLPFLSPDFFLDNIVML